MQNAKSIFSHIHKETGDESENFIASRGRSDRFKKRANLHNKRINGKAAVQMSRQTFLSKMFSNH
ncbi:hypothetical protein T11_18605 [Trichinella zimbabwensis]|uniref:Uncharacterized protein n=1 Tax=Trichinella zimbabwensis TaxID=268475 RepID=A0A0V1I2Y7_9BILA|nr:hypothetical protein T11_18605 [Trichinella zimbabwensis]